MAQLLNNYNLLLGTSSIFERSHIYTLPFHRFPSISPIKHTARSNLRMSQPGSTQDAQRPVIHQQKVIIENNRGEKLVGSLHETGSVGIIILCHGFRSTKENNTMMNLAVALENEGISAFRFDFAGNGESEGSFQYGGYWREADDLHAVIQHFRGAKRVIHAIVGHSKGGNVVLLYASKYRDISMVLNVSGRYNLKRGIGERLGEDFLERIKKDGFLDVKNKTGSVNYRVTEESLIDRLNTDMHEACLKIEKDCRVLTIHGSADEVIPVEDALEFAKIIPNHKLHIIQGADHGYTSHQAELCLIVLNFVRTGLQEGKDEPQPGNAESPLGNTFLFTRVQHNLKLFINVVRWLTDPACVGHE